jgi:hypothetical protein
MISARRSLARAKCRVGIDGTVVLVSVISIRLVWRTASKTPAIAEVRQPWAAGYSGWLGVVTVGVQVRSGSVDGLPSSRPGVAIAVTGRQKP